MNFICKKCGKCCKNGIVIIYPEDILPISSKLLLSPNNFIKKYCKKVYMDINNDLRIKIYYLNNFEKCNFLSKDNLCLINDVKPLQCRLGPEKYFNSIDTWKNCKQLSGLKNNPFAHGENSEEFFVRKLLSGYSFN